MVSFPVKHVREGNSKWFKYCRAEFYNVLFYHMKHKYFVWTWNISLFWIFMFSYTKYLVEKLLLYTPHNKNSFSTKYAVFEKINIHNNKIFYVRYAILQKTTEEICKYVQKILQ